MVSLADVSVLLIANQPLQATPAMFVATHRAPFTMPLFDWQFHISLDVMTTIM